MLLVTACAGTPEPSPGDPALNRALARYAPRREPGPEYLVEPPDELLLTVTDNPELETRAPVRPDGRMSVPLVGDVLVGGRTVATIERELEQKLSRYIRRADVTVTVTAFRSKRVYVYGEVERPGAYPFTGRDTVVSTIAQAGTLNWRAAPNGIQVTRGDPLNPTILPVRLKDIVLDDDDATNWMLAADDIVWVPPTTMVKVGDVMREIFWPFQWLLAPVQAYGTVEDVRD
ncbi:MAG: polysaccharide export protein [Planctomycetes bacterium]|nr:polysaccharide export protein [Planctomycetota bacterium]